MNPSCQDLMNCYLSGEVSEVLRGEKCVFITPSGPNGELLPTDHNEILKFVDLAFEKNEVKDLVDCLEKAIIDIAHDSLGLYCSIQCFYVQVIRESSGKASFNVNRELLSKYLGDAFERMSDDLHSLELKKGDLDIDRSYKITLSKMKILSRDYDIKWPHPLPDFIAKPAKPGHA